MSVESLGTVQLRVRPEVLISQAEKVREHLSRMTARFDELERIINRSSHFWLGEGGEVYREIYRENSVPVREMLRRLREYPDDLLKISGNYTRTEKKLSEAAAVLRSDVIH